MTNRTGRERGWSATETREQLKVGRLPRGAILVGSPEGVAEKIHHHHELFGHERFVAQICVGALPHGTTTRAIELSGTEVAPASERRSRAAPPPTTHRTVSRS